MPIVMIHIDEKGKGKTSDALEWFFSQDSPKAYITPTCSQLKNLPVDICGQGVFQGRNMDKFRGVDLQAIVIDELDMFDDSVKILSEAFCHMSAKIYICGTPIKDYGVSPLMFLGIINQDTGFVAFGTKEMAEAAFKSRDFVVAFISPGVIGALRCTT